MLSAIEEGGHTRGMTDRMRELEAREDVLEELLAQEPADISVAWQLNVRMRLFRFD